MALAAASGPEQRYLELLENANDIIYTHDLAGNFTSLNAAAERTFGYTRGELVGSHIRRLVDPAWLPVAAENLRRKAVGGVERTPPYELLTRAKDGHEVWVEVSTRVILDSGRPVGIQGIARDVTERHRREEVEARLREQEHHEVERLAELERFKSDFLRTAAHELGTPLTPIRIQVRLLRQWAEQHPDEPQGHAVAVIDRNLERLNHLVQDLLQAARLQCGRLVVKPAPTDLADLVRDAVETYQPSGLAEQVSLAASCPEHVPIVGDGDRLTQVIGNLLSNAIKYNHPRGTVELRVEAEEEAVKVTVADSGLGFTPAQAALLFQPFMQIHDVRQANRPGTGLGLYICKGIVEQHGGEIGCGSPGPGCGADFWFRIPRQPPPSSMVEQAA